MQWSTGQLASALSLSKSPVASLSLSLVFCCLSFLRSCCHLRSSTQISPFSARCRIVGGLARLGCPETAASSRRTICCWLSRLGYLLLQQVLVLLGLVALLLPLSVTMVEEWQQRWWDGTCGGRHDRRRSRFFDAAFQSAGWLATLGGRSTNAHCGASEGSTC